MWKYRLLAPDSWGTHQNFWKPRLLHLPIHRKVVNSLTWDIWFSFIYNKFLILRLPALCCKITIDPVSSPFLLEKFLRALWKFISRTMLCLVTQSCLISSAPWIVDCQAALSKAILQVRILEWAAMPPRPSFRGSSQPRNGTQVSHLAIAATSVIVWATREVQEYCRQQPIPSPAALLGSGIELGSPALQVDSLPAELPRKPLIYKEHLK